MLNARASLQIRAALAYELQRIARQSGWEARDNQGFFRTFGAA